MMTEAVRLVVWDLDETFWKGTLTEGGIKEYVQEHHDIVITLAKRGILSSICSKNDRDIVLRILKERNISEYFVFPSISWESKGLRLAQLVDAVQLRPTTVMFIDDNANNRGEAEAIVPGIQTAEETFIPNILSDPRFMGKDDRGLTRLAQYKLLEQRKRDEQSVPGSNEDFLRSCNIQVFIDYDVENNLDRAVELINRTNQLNFTKRRLPENEIAARQELTSLITHFSCQAGLIRVADKYGDYGYVGFFASFIQRSSFVEGHANRTLRHFCFSCRTLGMLVEKWVYDFLGRPELIVIGEVLTDLSAPKQVDWIEHVQTFSVQAPKIHESIAPQIVIWGGCEAHAVAVYLQAYTAKIEAFGNYAADGLFVRSNTASGILDVCDRSSDSFAVEAKTLGLPLQFEARDIFAEAEAGALFIFNLSLDAHAPRSLLHKTFKWRLILEARSLPGVILSSVSADALDEHLRSNANAYSPKQHLRIRDAWEHLRETYDLLEPSPEYDRVEDVRSLLERTPVGCKVIIALNHPYIRNFPQSETKAIPSLQSFERALTRLIQDYEFASLVSVSDVIHDINDLREADHYGRQVYLRFAEHIVQRAQSLRSRITTPEPKHRLIGQSGARRLQSANDHEHLGREVEMRGLVNSVYKTFFRRDPEPAAVQHVTALTKRKVPVDHFIANVVRSPEFLKKWSAKS